MKLRRWDSLFDLGKWKSCHSQVEWHVSCHLPRNLKKSEDVQWNLHAMASQLPKIASIFISKNTIWENLNKIQYEMLGHPKKSQYNPHQISLNPNSKEIASPSHEIHGIPIKSSPLKNYTKNPHPNQIKSSSYPMKSSNIPMKSRWNPYEIPSNSPVTPRPRLTAQIPLVAADLHRCGSARSTKAGGHSCGWDQKKNMVVRVGNPCWLMI